jgi:hypothetical protein
MSIFNDPPPKLSCDFFLLNFVAALGDTTGGHSVQSPLAEDNAQQGTDEELGIDADGQEGVGAGGVGGNFGLLFDIADLFVNYTSSQGTMLQLITIFSFF